MNELIHIGNVDISVKEYKGQRVVTFKDIDMVHKRPDGTARATFNRNKDHFSLGGRLLRMRDVRSQRNVWNIST